MGVGIAAAAAARAEGLSSEEQATRAGEAGLRLLPMNSGDVLLHGYGSIPMKIPFLGG